MNTIQFIEGLQRSIYNQDTEYHWSYSLRDKVQGIDSNLMKGDTLEAATELLTALGKQLHEALAVKDDLTAFNAIRAIMDWGKVYYPQGPRSMNQEKVKGLFESGRLIEEVSHNWAAIQSSNFTQVTLMNSGWTKVWAVLGNEHYIMLDDRVCATFGRYITDFTQQYSDFSVNEAATALGFYQTGFAKTRRVNDIPRIHSRPHIWVKSMLVVAKYLKAVVDKSFYDGCNRYDNKVDELRFCEAQLFMRGA